MLDVRTVFVTVGTTKFRSLALFPSEVLKRAPTKHDSCLDHVSQMVIQAGADFELVAEELEESKQNIVLDFDWKSLMSGNNYKIGVFPKSKVLCLVFDYSTSITSFVKSSSILISHGGTGTVLESLSILVSSKKQPRIVLVSNPSLLHNHQLDFVNELDKSGIIVAASSDDFKDILNAIKKARDLDIDSLINKTINLFPSLQNLTNSTIMQPFSAILQEELSK